jgi:hypothetical protein
MKEERITAGILYQWFIHLLRAASNPCGFLKDKN